MPTAHKPCLLLSAHASMVLKTTRPDSSFFLTAFTFLITIVIAMHSMTQKFLIILAVSTIAVIGAQAELTYTETGGNISGSLNGVGFLDATWTITATADPTTAMFYAAGANNGDIYAPVWSIFVTPTITITSGPTILSATLSGWDIESRDYSAFNPPDTAAAIMFSNADADGNGGVEQGNAAYTTGTSANFNNLQSTGDFSGTSDFDTVTYVTSAGDLIVSSDSGQPGTFDITITPVPEPSALGLAALGGLGVLAGFRRRK